MSGVELAGLVLGVLPLAISAMEAYNESLDPVKAFFGWEKELPKFIRRLRNQHVHYEQTLRQLLGPIVSEEELAEMLQEPYGELWKDEGVSMKLNGKLAESKIAYQNTMSDIERIMKKIASKMDLEGFDRSSPTLSTLESVLRSNPRKSGSDTYQFGRRLKFSLSKKRIKSLLDELDECNKELERFTDKSEKLEPYRAHFRSTSTASVAGPLQRIQGYARNLHGVLSLAWTCGCQDHSSNLRLEQRGIDLKGKTPRRVKVLRQEPICFSVGFAGKEAAWSWQEARINIAEDDPDCEDEESLSESQASLTKAKSKVRIMTDPLSPPPSYEESTSLTTSTKPTSSEAVVIEDICHAIHRFNGSSELALSLRGEKLIGANPSLNALSTDKKAPHRSDSDMVTLQDLLTPSSTTKLSRRERYILSVTLASSVLQLHGSPWLESAWCKSDILFLSNSDGVDIAHPYVCGSTITSQPQKDKNVKSPLTQSPSFPSYARNTALLNLGLVLLELYFNTSADTTMFTHFSQDPFSPPSTPHVASSETPLSPLVSSPKPTPIPSNPLLGMATAQSWIDARREDLSAAFLHAVGHCLKCFVDPSGSLADELFLQQAVEQIVVPLQEELGTFVGGA